jgi:hypothetical protein
MPRSIQPAIVARTLPFAAFMALLTLRVAVPEEGLWGLDVRWLYGVKVLVVGALLAWFWRAYGELARPHLPTPSQTGLAVIAGLAVFVAWIHLDAPWMTLDLGDTPAFVPLDAAGAPDWGLIVMRWIGAALLVPVMEELFWRSFLMRWLQQPEFTTLAPQDVGLRAVALSTFAFVLAHTMWLAAIVAGLAYAWLYIRTGRLWVAVIAHAVTNGALGIWVVSTGQWQFW